MQLTEKGSKNDKTKWFSKLGYHNTMMVPASPGRDFMSRKDGTLTKPMARIGFMTLVLEDGGKSAESDIVKSNPFSSSKG